MLRFAPAYWCVNFGTTCAGSVVVQGSSGLLVTCDFRTDTDIIGLYWYSTDTLSHTLYRYETNRDYSATTLDFDFVLTNIRDLAAINGPTLTVNHTDGSASYVRLSNYITSGTASAGHVHLPFASVLGGFNATDPINWTNVDNLMLSLVHTTYNPSGSGTALSPAQTGTLAMSNIAVTGPQLAQSTTALGAHTLRMTDGYDDSYPQTPTRFVQQMYQLGYRSWYSIYMGISHHHDVVWNAGQSRFVVNPSGSIINASTRAWFTSLMAELATRGYTDIIVSISYEIVNYLMPTGWQQLDADGNPGVSGWSPPSQFVSPSNTTALTYLANVVKTIFSLMPAGPRQWLQVGEPWWWDNSFTNNKPCFYDSLTNAAYTAQTGQAVPTPWLTSNQAPVTPTYSAYCTWLAGQLSASTFSVRSQVKATYPSCGDMVLFFTPQIFASQLMRTVNLPSGWNAPAWQVLQVEDYDWVIEADWVSHATTWTTVATMGYSLTTNTHYFSGFNLQASTAQTIWPNVSAALWDAIGHGVKEIWAWARPEIFRDGYVWPEGAPVASSTTLAIGQVSVRTFVPVDTGNDTVFLEWSDDRGHSYGNPVGQTIGETGQYLTSVQWQRLGYGRDRVFRVTWSVPTLTALQGAYIELDKSPKS